MINCAIYPRKSKETDNSDSIGTQIDMCIRYLNEKYGQDNYNAIIYDADYGISGHSTKNRPDFNRMMNDVRSGLIQLVVIQRYDRIARNVRDFCNLYYDMEQVGCNLVSVSQQIDTTTPYGKNFMYTQASMAELEWALNSERRKEANLYAVSIGKWLKGANSTTIGYKAEMIDGVRRLVINREKEPIVRDIFSHFKLYKNYTATTRYINIKYNLNYQRRQINRIINNELYKGWYRGNHSFCEPYLSEKEWDELQVNNSPIRSDPKKRREPIFAGLIKCPICGRNLRSQQKKTENGTRYRYYLCQNKQIGRCSFLKVRSELKIEKELLEIIDDAFKNVKYEYDVNKSNQNTSENKIASLKKEQERLNSMFQKGRISEEKYDQEYMQIERDILMLQSSNATTVDIGALEIAFAKGWKEEYLQLDELHKKLFWRSILKQIVIDENSHVIGVIFL